VNPQLLPAKTSPTQPAAPCLKASFIPSSNIFRKAWLANKILSGSGDSLSQLSAYLAISEFALFASLLPAIRIRGLSHPSFNKKPKLLCIVSDAPGTFNGPSGETNTTLLTLFLSL